MSFLAPLFLLGATALALPILFHLIRRTTRERVRFSSLMFLRPEPPRLTQRNRIEHWLLLLLRCAALGLLALGFARPFFKQDVPALATPDPARQVAILVDSSASMRRGTAWTDAIARAGAALRRLTPSDSAAVYTFNRTMTTQVSRDEWNATPTGERVGLALARLEAVKPSWQTTRLDQALTQAADRLNEMAGPRDGLRREIVVITDWQAGARLTDLQNYNWPAGIAVRVERVTAAPAGNASVQLLADLAGASPARDPTVRVRVTNEPDSAHDQFQLAWAGPNGPIAGAATDVYAPAGQSRVVTLPVPPTNAVADRIVLRGDEQAFDNTLYAIPPQAVRFDVLYAGADADEDPRGPLFFLKRAFQDTPLVSVRVVSAEPMPDPDAGPLPHLAVVTGAITESVATRLRPLLAAGRVVVFAPLTAAEAPTLGRLVEGVELRAVEERPAKYAMFGEVDFQHPLFAPMADPRFSDFTKIHFWQYRRLEFTAPSDPRVVARFDSGDPALIEVAAGRGRVFVFASTWRPDDSQLALSSKFVPLLYAALEVSGGRPPEAVPAYVGTGVRLPVAGLAAAGTVAVSQPDGTKIDLPAGTESFEGAREPGIYELAAAGEHRRFAVNLDPAESRTAPLPADELDRLGVPGVGPAAEPAREAQRQARLQNAELESRQKLWRWLLVAALAILLLETWLAGWTARRIPQTQEATT